jgi:thiol-disulfide isomerase/thioredoxin
MMNRLLTVITVLIVGVFLIISFAAFTQSDTGYAPEGKVAVIVETGESIQPYVDFTWKDVNGQTGSLRDHKGKVVLLNFWATWCVPCRKEIPELVEINSELNGKKFLMIGVSVDQGPNIINKVNLFIEQMNIDYLNILDDGRLVNQFGSISGVPTTILIDKEGKVVDVMLGVRTKEQFMEKISALL